MTLVIGYGNTLRGDDGFGPRAAEALRGVLRDNEVEILAAHQLTPELMEPVSRATRVVFIDAAVGGEPGKLTAVRLEPGESASGFTHFATPAGLLAGVTKLYGRCVEGVLVTVAGANFELGEGLSEPVTRALDELVRTRLAPYLRF